MKNQTTAFAAARRLFILFFTGACIFVLFSFTNSSGTKSRLQLAGFSGEALFADLFFGQGNISQSLPIFKTGVDTDPCTTSRKRTDVAQVMHDMQTAIPGFFAGFKKNILSGQPLEIRHALQQTTRLLASLGYKNSSAATGSGNTNVLVFNPPPPPPETGSVQLVSTARYSNTGEGYFAMLNNTFFTEKLASELAALHDR